MSDDDPLYAEERWLMEQLHEMRLRHEAEMKPLIDRLVRLKSLRLPWPNVVPIELVAGILHAPPKE